jgi:transcriptional regulator with XRE-family HTH domain
MIRKFLLSLKEKGWTQEAIADKAGIRQSLVSRLFTGADCSGKTLIKIADAFGVTTDEVLGRTEKKPDPPRNTRRASAKEMI